MRRLHGPHIVVAAIRLGIAAVVTALVEKNAAKRVGFRTPVVLSMTRVIVLAFAVAMVREIWEAGVSGWPEATLSIAVVLATPIVSALDRATASEVVNFAGALLGRFGEGAARSSASMYPAASSKPDADRSEEEHEPAEAA